MEIMEMLVKSLKCYNYLDKLLI